MAWYDRDYAREPSRGFHRVPGRLRLLIGGSIVTTLIVVNVVVYVTEELFPSFGTWLSGKTVLTREGVVRQYGVAELWSEAVLHGQVWRLFTAQYLHANTWHLFINMLVLHFLGRPLEDRWSTREFLFVYTLSGLAGNIFYTLLGWVEVIDPTMPAVGASGCIYGLLGIVAVLFPHATVYVYFLFPIKIRTAAVIFGGIAFLTVVSRGVNYGGEACHLAGLVFGVWWAWKGEGWWMRNRHRLPTVFRGRRARGSHYPGYLKPSGFADRIADRRIDQVEVDRILKKVYDHGLHSLTPTERDYLRDATERQRERETQTGRVDRL
jgi:membrane associated rhomboid family serine protease